MEREVQRGAAMSNFSSHNARGDNRQHFFPLERSAGSCPLALQFATEVAVSVVCSLVVSVLASFSSTAISSSSSRFGFLQQQDRLCSGRDSPASSCSKATVWLLASSRWSLYLLAKSYNPILRYSYVLRFPGSWMVLAEEQYLPQLPVLRWPLKRLTQDVSRGIMSSL